ncbi:MAG: primosomal protein N' [Rhodospirillales bacterium]
MPPPETSLSGTDSQDIGGTRVSVLLPLPLAGPYDYRLDSESDILPGTFVRVPLGNRVTEGVLWGDGSGAVEDKRLKPVSEALPTVPLPEVSRRFVDWVANYTMTPPGAVLRMVMSVPEALYPPPTMTRYELAPGFDDHPPGFRETAARLSVIEQARAGPPRSAADLARDAGCSSGVVTGLADAGVLRRVEMTPPPPAAPDADAATITLSSDQAANAQVLADAVRRAAFEVFVLDGVTGSGKTEVYFEAVAEALRQGRQVLVMLPEIALGQQWRSRFRNRFGAAAVEWHSDLTQATRRETWRAVANGTARVVVGARSALFLPFPDLGLIVVDEEHDAAYKQEDGVIYNARDMAVVRARLSEIPAVLVSATPSLETLTNAEQGRYRALSLSERHAGAALPEVTTINMRDHAPAGGRWMSDSMLEAVEETLANGEQVMLYLNRRGYAPLTLCRACGHRFQCPQCSAWLVEHRLVGRLQCHHCGYNVPPPDSCPSCGAAGSLAACGPGVERLAEEARSLFPAARVAIAASDTLQSPRAAAEMIGKLEAGEIDIVVGTQIIAKGYHFPMLTLIGVIDADIGLSGGDLRAAERTFQMLHQVSGRAGRAERPGRVALQTYLPEHPVIEALGAGDRDRFITAERDSREAARMPPFGRLVALIVSGTDEALVERAAKALGRNAPTDKDLRVFGPAPAPFALLRGRHRRRLLMHSAKGVPVQGIVEKWLKRAGLPKKVRVQVDVDPYSFY